MKTEVGVGLSIGIVGVVALVLLGLGAGWALWGRPLWAAEPFAMPSTATTLGAPENCGGWGYGMGPGMMDGEVVPAAPCAGWGYKADPETTGSTTSTLTIEEAHEAVEQYIAERGYSSLELAEMME